MTGHRFATRTAALIAAALLSAACGSGGSGSDGPAVGGPDEQSPVTIELWSFFTEREKGVVDGVLKDFEAEYPWITVKHVGGQSDETVLQAARGGTAPDLSLSGQSDAGSSYCSSGVFDDLTQRIADDGIDVEQFLPGSARYTTSGDIRCAFPVLADVYGLYYDPELLAEAGFDQPPKTWTELTEMAKALTIRSADGTIERAGFVPLMDFGQNGANKFTTGWDLTWYDPDGKPQMSADPRWAEMLEWQKGLVDWYGYDNLQRFVAGLGAEFSAENPFQTGQVAMAVDGEWRVAFVDDQSPDLNYSVAPIPAVDPSTYGSGYIGGTLVGMLKGGDHPDAAWLLTRYLAADTDALVALTLGLRNIPSTTDSQADPRVAGVAQFDALIDIAAHPASDSVPGTAAGAAPNEIIAQFVQTWQSGNVPDLDDGLAELASQVDLQIKQSAGGNAP